MNEIYQQRRKRPRLCVDTREDHEAPLTPEEFDLMRLDEVKEKLKELQVKTKVRKLEKLREILKSQILENAHRPYVVPSKCLENDFRRACLRTEIFLCRELTLYNKSP